MVDAASMIWVALGALGVGLMVPLLVQAFLTLRLFHRTVAGIEARAKETFDRVDAMSARLSASPEAHPPAWVTAALPVVVAAIKALRKDEPDNHRP